MGRGRKLMSSVFRRHFRGDEEVEAEQRSTENTWPSDGDSKHSVAELDIDRKAAEFGDRKHSMAESDIDRKATEFINKERCRINMGGKS